MKIKTVSDSPEIRNLSDGGQNADSGSESDDGSDATSEKNPTSTTQKDPKKNCTLLSMTRTIFLFLF